MIVLKIIVSMATIITFTQARAQVTSRERNTSKQIVIRDSASDRKKLIEEKYDSLINKCRSQIIMVSFEIAGLQKKIENLKTQVKQSELDYQNWLKNASGNLNQEQIQVQSQQKQKELDKKISDLNMQINTTKKNINTKEVVIKQLKSQNTQLEKEKAAALSKS